MNSALLVASKNRHQSYYLKLTKFGKLILRKIIKLLPIPVLGSQPASDMSHKPGGRLPLLSARPAVTSAPLKRAGIIFNHDPEPTPGISGVVSKTVTRQRSGCELNPVLWARWTGDIDRLQLQWSNAGSATSSAYLGI